MDTFLWYVIQNTFNLPNLPATMKIMLCSWISLFGKVRKRKLCIGISALLRSIWTCRNYLCFERRRVIDPFVILHKSFQLIESWSILQTKEENQRELRWEVKLLERVASEVFHASRAKRQKDNCREFIFFDHDATAASNTRLKNDFYLLYVV